MELNEQQEAWADSYVGSQMRASKGAGIGDKGTILSWTPGRNCRGVWFYISGPNQEWGRKRYRQFPGRLKVPQVPDPNVIQSGMEKKIDIIHMGKQEAIDVLVEALNLSQQAASDLVFGIRYGSSGEELIRRLKAMEPVKETPKGMRRDPVVVAYLQEVGFDQEGLPNSGDPDPYSTVVGVIAAALDYAFDAIDEFGGIEGNIMADVARALLKGDPHVGGDHWDFEIAELLV